LLRALEALESWIERFLAVVITVGTQLAVRVMRRGRFRAWRRDGATEGRPAGG
jgi:hypothetical protein